MKGKGTWNAGNPAVKRILKEAKEMDQNPCREFVARPLEENVFEWLFTLRGPDETEYENGFYRGRIILQSNYPFAPPDIELLTPNGRFELNKKICLSISSYHPENWHPTWGIKTVLHALREFMSTPGNNAIGAIEYSKEKRRQLARESHDFICPVLKVPIKEDIELMNNSPPSVDNKLPELPLSPSHSAQEEGAAGLASLDGSTLPPGTPKAAQDEAPSPATTDQNVIPDDKAVEGVGVAVPEEPAPAAPVPADPAPEAPQAAAPADPPHRPRQHHSTGHGPVIVISESALDYCISFVVVVILAILFKKVVSNGWLSVVNVF